MEFEGFVIHHTACSEEGHEHEHWDFMIKKDGSVEVLSTLRQSEYIFIGLEGDFNMGYELMDLQQKTQLFAASKIIIELSRLYSISPLYLFPHGDQCPGSNFPWNALVIYPAGGYH
ncbi:N-acetylmuramoyl-L-alanine amidase [Paenibacillus lemnae]|uniref:N-acetylmuramoyl-L-alanine amidase n=1 Tax=Paenibacillus lemnae TaxID=1330551 RepID=A0A848M8H0_PAELE|nr:N-acetylmuramoyl-L-alanine amidase [Paenibacillus lemnae]NMO96935.1 N-acetylmuramoyl-L-alanine amidase [Paenibacillus lemnae]